MQDLGRWNAGASGCWNHLRTLLKRDHPGLEFLGTQELQERKAIHRHTLVSIPDSEPALDVLRVQDLAQRAGYGCVIDLAPIVAGTNRHAYYVSKYVTKAADTRGDTPWTIDQVDTETGELRPLHTVATYRSWSASRGWGLTMKQVRSVSAAAARGLASVTASTPLTAVSAATIDGVSDPQGPSPPV